MLRSEWKFDYTAAQLADAARAKIIFHDAQLEFWKAKRTEVMATIKDEGIEVHEKVALGFSNPKARDFERGGEIVIRNDLRNVLTETFDKLKYHTKLRDTYNGWEQVLSANLANSLSLDINDWLFFFGRDTVTDDEDEL